jgi:hypothetical protein
MADRLADYEPVQARLARFWTDHPQGRVDCRLLEHDDTHVLAKAWIWRDIVDRLPAAVGYAAETHDGSPVNKQGWMVENAETSAIGRALANLGYAPKTTRPSQEDMARAGARLSGPAQIAASLRAHGVKQRADMLRAVRQVLCNPLIQSSKELTPAEIAQVLEMVNGLGDGVSFPFIIEGDE